MRQRLDVPHSVAHVILLASCTESLHVRIYWLCRPCNVTSFYFWLLAIVYRLSVDVIGCLMLAIVSVQHKLHLQRVLCILETLYGIYPVMLTNIDHNIAHYHSAVVTQTSLPNFYRDYCSLPLVRRSNDASHPSLMISAGHFVACSK